MLTKVFEFGRWALLAVGIFLSYFLGDNDPQRVLHLLVVLAIVPLTALTGIEGMFFGAASAESMGRRASEGYQRQSGGANLGFAITGLIVFFAGWGPHADATLLLVALLFFVFSGAVHGWEAIARGNRSRKNLMRPILTGLLLGVCAWPLIAGLAKAA